MTTTLPNLIAALDDGDDGVVPILADSALVGDRRPNRRRPGHTRWGVARHPALSAAYLDLAEALLALARARGGK